jgi:arginyl-tRNA synthetase
MSLGMATILAILQERFRQAIEGLTPDAQVYAELVRPTQDPRHGDYQANSAMSLAKVLGRKPREIAQDIVGRLQWQGLTEPPEIAGPGFVNLRLTPEWLASQLTRLTADERLGIEPAAKPRTLIIDYSSPNVAKPMHVGHLRSTIIGEALARLFRFLGHRVITDNHLGDWGTQFGILLYGYKNFRDEGAMAADPVRELARIYVHVRSLMKSDEEAEAANDPIAEAARQETAKLHSGDPENVRLWRMFMPWCLEEIDRIYVRLNVKFDHTFGESFYQPMLTDTVRSLEEKSLARDSQGALAIFFGENEPPALVRKRDGAFTYTTTDLATIRYRMEQWHPDVVLYVVDSRQALHFKYLFDAARRWGYTEVKLEHVSFGSVLGQDKKPIKTREGGAVELGALLDEAVERASQAYEQTRAERAERGQAVADLSEEEHQHLVEAVGIGAVKYADLSQNRMSDYVFSWDKMLAMDGNTATYMQYAYARIRSIFREGEIDVEGLRAARPQVQLQKPAERDLAVMILRFQESLDAAADEYKPSVITSYLWDLAKSYSSFYQECPVLKAGSPELRQSRLVLCDLTARTIKLGLYILGIETVERM